MLARQFLSDTSELTSVVGSQNNNIFAFIFLVEHQNGRFLSFCFHSVKPDQFCIDWTSDWFVGVEMGLLAKTPPFLIYRRSISFHFSNMPAVLQM